MKTLGKTDSYPPRVFSVTFTTFSRRIRRFLNNHAAVVINCMTDPLRRRLIPDLAMSGKKVICVDFLFPTTFRGNLGASSTKWVKRIDEAINLLSQPFDVFVFDVLFLEGGFHLFCSSEQSLHIDGIREKIIQMWELIKESAQKDKKFIFRVSIDPSSSFFNKYEIPLGSRVFFTAPVFDHKFTQVELEWLIGEAK